MKSFHKTVLLKETVDLLRVGKGKRYIDATLGGGGHAKEIIKRGGLVLGIDQDQDSINYVRQNLEAEIKNSKLKLVKGNFKNLGEIAKEEGFENANGIIFDLGISSFQIDTGERGFSFLKSGPLDMRMDRDLEVSAEHLINLLGRRQLHEIFKNYGEIYNAKPIVNAIVSRRKMKAIKTTDELVEILGDVYGIKGEITDFDKNRIAQKVFQALRIAVNNELENLKEGINTAFKLLVGGGVLAVISFHSLEDRIVKETFTIFESEYSGRILTEKVITATPFEMEGNRRSKSAKLRAIEKII